MVGIGIGRTWDGGDGSFDVSGFLEGGVVGGDVDL